MNHRMCKAIAGLLAVTVAFATPAFAATSMPGHAGLPHNQACPPPFVQKGEWKLDEYGPILEITPTACGRTVQGWDIEVFDAEVVRKFSGNAYWRNSQGLLDQLECHIRKFPTKPTYNIEPDRPYVGRTGTEAADCNPNVADPDPSPKT